MLCSYSKLSLSLVRYMSFTMPTNYHNLGEQLAELCCLLSMGRPSILAGAAPDCAGASGATLAHPALLLAQRLQHHLDRRGGQQSFNITDDVFGRRTTVVIMDRSMDLASAFAYDLALQVKLHCFCCYVFGISQLNPTLES